MIGEEDFYRRIDSGFQALPKFGLGETIPVILALIDWLRERGDEPRADAWQWIANEKKYPVFCVDCPKHCWGWIKSRAKPPKESRSTPATIPWEMFFYLQDFARGRTTYYKRRYETRSDAYRQLVRAKVAWDWVESQWQEDKKCQKTAS